MDDIHAKNMKRLEYLEKYAKGDTPIKRLSMENKELFAKIVDGNISPEIINNMRITGLWSNEELNDLEKQYSMASNDWHYKSSDELTLKEARQGVEDLRKIVANRITKPVKENEEKFDEWKAAYKKPPLTRKPLLKIFFKKMTKPRLSYLDFIIVLVVSDLVMPIVIEIIKGLF